MARSEFLGKLFQKQTLGEEMFRGFRALDLFERPLFGARRDRRVGV